VGEDDRVGVPIGDIRRDACHGEHGRRGGQADDAVDAAHRGYGRVIAGRCVAVGGEPVAGCFGMLCLLCGSAYRTQIGPGDSGMGHRLLLGQRLGGIWEIASGANCREPRSTELKWSV
jgi:hypothetical protein